MSSWRTKKLRKVLRGFWRRVYAGEDKLALLVEFAGRGVPGNHLYRVVRRQKKYGVTGNPAICFVCSDPSDVRHHIIQVQHGGRNIAENVVPLCTLCHAAVHPWLMDSAIKHTEQQAELYELLRPVWAKRWPTDNTRAFAVEKARNWGDCQSARRGCETPERDSGPI